MPRLIALGLAASLAAPPAFAQTEDHAPTRLSSSAQLRHDKGESWTYVKPGLALSAYRAALVEPTAVYSGPDAQFEGIEAADRRAFADLITKALTAELAESPGLAKAGPGVLRVKLTLLGAEKTVGGVSTATRVTPFGFATSAVKSAIGKEGSFTGSVLLAVEITDAASGDLLIAAVRRMAPDALDISATLSTTDTVKAVAEDVAERLRKRLDKGMKKGG